MRLSEYLQNRIDRSRAVLYTVSTAGWQVIAEEQLDRLELQAFKNFLNLPVTQTMDAETHRLVLENQMQAKYAEIFRNIAKTYRDQLEQDIAMLMQIQNGWEENAEVPETGPEAKKALKESLKDQWRRFKEEIARHVNV